VSSHELNRMIRILEMCLRDSAVFSRDVSSKTLIEYELFKDKNSVLWAILAAGIESDAASAISSRSRERSTQ